MSELKNIEPITVSQLTRDIKILLENKFSLLLVIGEISNFKRHSQSGHCYFVLKDEGAVLNATLWNLRYRELKFTPQDGQRVLAQGRITVYEPRGNYQFDVFGMQPYGIGDLQLAFEELKNKLQKEGLFEQRFKKPLPEFPMKVAIITSETGAVIRDFKTVAAKRFPIAKIYLLPARVQGPGSVEDVCRALEFANSSDYNFDLIVLARGGGSLEDLWTFNEEAVARAVFKSKIPVVSAIGHEVDFTICDFVADLRAPTPSAAAEIIFPDRTDLLERMKRIEYNLHYDVKEHIRRLKDAITSLSKNYFFNKPRDILVDYKIRLDDIYKDLNDMINNRLDELKNILTNSEQFLKQLRMSWRFKNYHMVIEESSDRLNRIITNRLASLATSVDSIEKVFQQINPELTLRRGYTYILRDDKTITRSKELRVSDEVEIVFYDGKNKATIKK
ncbi:MAG: exodeoxyribonuclease VII large subunit [Ignavibacteria bacterium]